MTVAAAEQSLGKIAEWGPVEDWTEWGAVSQSGRDRLRSSRGVVVATERRRQMTNDERRPEPGNEKSEEQQGESDGEGAGPAESLQEDPAYNPQGPERKYKGG